MTAHFTNDQVNWLTMLAQIRLAMRDSGNTGLREGSDHLSVGTSTRSAINGQTQDQYYLDTAEPWRQFIANVLTVAVGREAFWMIGGLQRSNFPVAEGRIRGRFGAFEYALYPNELDGALRITVGDWFPDMPTEGEPTVGAARTDIVVRQLTGWSEGFVEIRPSDELLERVPQRARQYAFRTDVAPPSGTRQVFWVQDDEGTFQHTMLTDAGTEGYIQGSEIVASAMSTYREMLRERMQRPHDEAEAARQAAVEEHRQRTQQNFRTFAQRPAVEEVLVPTLPFVPNGLASSRRWGIEVESGGARGVETPQDWRAISDGSLRSAYDGYVEVQDFEPFDEEVTENVSWRECANAERHNPAEEYYDAERQEYRFRIRENFIPADECQACGPVTRIVRREPQTIRHSARNGDCREFVSPILTSMHSRGLKSLTEALSRNPQNSSAGVHVHVEASDLSPKQLQTLVFGYDILEPLLEPSYKRERRDFCRRREVDAVLSHARDARNGNQLQVDDRYLTLNLQSLNRHGTVEFRAMGPVYEYDHLIRWAMLCRELVNAVAAGATMKDFSKVTNWSALLNLLARFGKEYIRAAVYEMTGEVGEAAKLEKRGVPVTQDALAADLSTAWETITQRFRDLGEAATSVASRLVGVGSTNET